MLRPRKALSILALALIPAFATAGQGCTAPIEQTQSADVTQLSGYDMDIATANQIWAGDTPIVKPEDAWTARVSIGGQVIAAPTHLFGPVLNVIPYSNEDGVKDATGAVFARGDQVIAKYFTPGQIGIGLKMHRPEHRDIDLDNADAANMKEDFKLQDTHIELVVGVEKAEHGKPGAITLNNPQNYENGRFGNKTYSMIFLRPELPDYAVAHEQAYTDNIRLALVGFNAVTNFPGDYNGGDPLGARNPDRVREYVDQMVRAIAGEQAAREWFEAPDNLVYCAELAFLSLSAGVIQPINATSMVPRVGQQTWDAYVAEIEKHNRGVDEFQASGNITEPSAFLALNDNKRVGMVRINLAPEALEPIAELSPDPETARQLLAYRPMTMSDIVEQFMRTHIPRETLGEALAPAQGGALAKMKPGLLEKMGMDQLPTTDPKRVAVEALFDKIVEVVATPFADYAAFRKALEPLLAQARVITGPRGDSGEGLFTPPSLFHVAAQGKHSALLQMQYEGHGVHVSAVRKSATPDPVPSRGESSVCHQERLRREEH